MTTSRLARDLWHALLGQRRVMGAVLPGVALLLLHSTAFDLPRAELVEALDSDRYRIQWIVGAYLLGGALGMALTGYCGRRFGLRNSYVRALALFAITSGIAGFAADVVSLAPVRFSQGLGMGLAISSGMVLLWRAFPQHRELAMALYGMAVYVPSLAGAVFGGLASTWFDWRAAFWINVPLGLAMAAIARQLLPPETEPRDRRASFDAIGALLLVACIVSLSVMVDLGQYWGWTNSPSFVPWLAVGMISTAAFIAWGIAAAHPLIGLRPLAQREFAVGLAIKIAFSINLYALVSLLASYMIGLRGYQWWQGALVVAAALATMPLGIAFGTLLGTDANRKVRMFGGLAVMTLATWQLGSVDVYTPKSWQASMLAMWGLGAGLVCGPSLLTMFEQLSADQSLEAAGVFNIARTLPAFAIGGLLVTLVARHSDENFDWLRLDIRTNRPIVAQALRDSAAHATVRGSTRDAAARQSQALLARWAHANARAYAFRDAFRCLAIAPVVGMASVLLLRIGPRRERDPTQAGDE